MVRYGRFTKINISKCEHFTREINCINLHLVVWFFFLVLIVSVVVFGVLCCFKLALLSLLFLLYDNGRNRSMHRQRYLQKAKGSVVVPDVLSKFSKTGNIFFFR